MSAGVERVRSESRQVFRLHRAASSCNDPAPKPPAVVVLVLLSSGIVRVTVVVPSFSVTTVVAMPVSPSRELVRDTTLPSASRRDGEVADADASGAAPAPP